MLGTNNKDLLADPLYLGWHHERVRGAEYDAFVDRFVQAVRGRFPDALLQWEDFAEGNARRLLDHYPDQLCTFIDDIQGLVHSGRGDLEAEKALYAQPQERITNWPITPSQMIGTAAQAGVFTEQIIRDMACYVERPVILPLSNPTSKSEAVPADVMDWTGGRALIATGSPLPDVTYHGRTISIGQCNNMFIFPGVGLSVLATQARHVTNEMFVAAARSLSACSPARSRYDRLALSNGGGCARSGASSRRRCWIGSAAGRCRRAHVGTALCALDI